MMDSQISFPFALSLSKGISSLKKRKGLRQAQPERNLIQGELILSLADRLPDLEVRR